MLTELPMDGPRTGSSAFGLQRNSLKGLLCPLVFAGASTGLRL
jgi:hypothetical protein